MVHDQTNKIQKLTKQNFVYSYFVEHTIDINYVYGKIKHDAIDAFKYTQKYCRLVLCFL